MAQKIESDKLLIKDVFSKWFRIPEYQRPYVWDEDQVTELLDDIMQAKVSNPDGQYFLGSLVLRKKEKEEGETKYIEYDLLDGQQRLTTLFLITAVVRDLTPATNSSRIKTCQDTIFQMANPDDNIPERLRVVFDIREQVKDFINEFIKEQGGTDKESELKLKINNKKEDISIRNMAKAILNIRDFFLNNSIDDFFPFLRSNVLLIYVAAEDLEDAFRLFTIMNSRGVKLRNSDILKADNLGKIKESSRLKFAKKWEETESYFGEDFDAFLSHIRTILVKQKAVSSLLKEFEDNIYNPKSFDRNTKTYTTQRPLLEKGEDTFKFVDRYKKHYEQLFENDNYDLYSSFELYNFLQLMQKGFEADLWIAPLLRYYDKFKTENLLDFVKALDNKFANDWLNGYTPTTRIENTNAIIQAIDDAEKSADILTSNSLKLDTKDLEEVLSGNIYGRRAARYVLLKLDLLYHGHTTKFDMPKTISIEHILPQTPDNSSQWKIDFSDIDRETWTNRIGNLVLISRRKNSGQGNKDYFDKKEKYFKNNVELFSNSIRIFNQYPTWTLTELKKNNADVLMKIKQGFGF